MAKTKAIITKSPNRLISRSIGTYFFCESWRIPGKVYKKTAGEAPPRKSKPESRMGAEVYRTIYFLLQLLAWCPLYRYRLSGEHVIGAAP